MTENTPYYAKKTLATPIGFVLFFFMFLYTIIDISSRENTFAIVLNWVLIALFAFNSILFAFLTIQSYRSVSYLTVKEDTLIIKNMFGKIRRVSVFEPYVVKRRNDDLKFILFPADKLLIGPNFDLPLEALVDYLESKNDQ